MATTVRITETYDLKTEVNKIGLIGIHTPSDALLRNMYPGLMKNHRFVRFLSCDVVGACASVLPADPLQVGVEAGDIAPEDMFNPILMRAVTNESFDTLVSKIYGGGQAVGTLGSVDSNVTDSANDFNVYYAMLAENGKFKKAMPQRGFSMKRLVPICHTLIASYGNMARIGNDVGTIADGENEVSVGVPNITDVPSATGLSSAMVTDHGVVSIFKGKSVRMPKIPLHYQYETNNNPVQVNVPKTFVAMLVTPPARLHSFYYRMRVTWTIRFEKVIPITEIGGFGQFNAVAPLSYYNGIEDSKTVLDAKTDLVDANGVDVNLVMQS